MSFVTFFETQKSLLKIFENIFKISLSVSFVDNCGSASGAEGRQKEPLNTSNRK